jgi:hypothetical protein
MTPLELKEMLRSKSAKKQEKINLIKDELIEKYESAEVAPLLDEADITLVA